MQRKTAIVFDVEITWVVAQTSSMVGVLHDHK